MDPKTTGRHDNPLQQEISDEQRQVTEAAHQQADKDIARDPDLSVHNRNDDLDEGEQARLGEDLSKII